MGNQRLGEIAEQALARYRPINELVGNAVNASVWVGFSVFVIHLLWFGNGPKPDIGAFGEVVRFTFIAVAAATSAAAMFAAMRPFFVMQIKIEDRLVPA